jgi:hypothetical protein
MKSQSHSQLKKQNESFNVLLAPGKHAGNAPGTSLLLE